MRLSTSTQGFQLLEKNAGSDNPENHTESILLFIIPDCHLSIRPISMWHIASHNWNAFSQKQILLRIRSFWDSQYFCCETSDVDVSTTKIIMWLPGRPGTARNNSRAIGTLEPLKIHFPNISVWYFGCFWNVSNFGGSSTHWENIVQLDRCVSSFIGLQLETKNLVHLDAWPCNSLD